MSKRKAILKNIQVIRSLLEDFKTNLIEIDNFLKNYPEWQERLRTTLSYARKSNAQLTDGMKDTIRGTNFVNTEIIQGTINSILSSDKLELLKNVELKKRITAYPARVEKLKQILKIMYLMLNEILKKFISY